MYLCKIHEQVIGIPMGCDCAPKVADLFLYWFDYISKSVIIFELLPVILVLKNCIRYIHDLNVPNANEEMCRIICTEIYPEELSIERTNTDLMISSFLISDIFVRREGNNGRVNGIIG